MIKYLCYYYAAIYKNVITASGAKMIQYVIFFFIRYTISRGFGISSLLTKNISFLKNILYRNKNNVDTNQTEVDTDAMNNNGLKNKNKKLAIGGFCEKSAIFYDQ